MSDTPQAPKASPGPEGRSLALSRLFFLTMLSPAGWLLMRVIAYSARRSEAVMHSLERAMVPFMALSPWLAVLALIGLFLASKRKDNGLVVMFAFSFMMNALTSFLWIVPSMIQAGD